MTEWLSSVVYQALDDGREVRLEESEGLGMSLLVDGAELIDGLPAELFDLRLDDVDLGDDGERVVAELVAKREADARRRRRRHEDERTADHRAAEGAALAHGGAP